MAPWLAVIALWLMEGSYLPQLYRLRRLREADEISLLFPLANVTGRLMVMLVMFLKGEHLFAWGFLVGVSLRGAFFAQVLYYRFVRGAALRRLDSRIVGAYSRPYLIDQVRNDLATLRRAGATRSLVFLEMSDCVKVALRMNLSMDELVARAVAVIRPMLRAGDALCFLDEACRLALLLRSNDRKGSLVAARRFARSISAALSVPGQPTLQLTARVVHLDDHLDRAPEDLLRAPGEAVDLSPIEESPVLESAESSSGRR